MPPTPERVAEPVLEVLDGLVPTELHDAAWKACCASRWHFARRSHDGDGHAPFWKLDLDDDAAILAMWERMRERCEKLAGAPLRIVRVYATGHNYGLGGRADADDSRPGTFTLLYYPMPEWKDGWEGETVWYDPAGEIALAVRPRPNRAVFFDSRLPHEGRAPSRACPALRVTVVFRLEMVAAVAPGRLEVVELRREGARREYAVRIPAAEARRAAREALQRIGRTVRLPGYRQGEIPEEVLAQRYGRKAAMEALDGLVGEALARALPPHSVPASVELKTASPGGDAEARVEVTVLGDLPAPDLSALRLTRLTGVAQGAARAHLKTQVLDFLDAAYPFAIRPELVERELDAIVAIAEQASGESREALTAELRPVADRRVRLGLLLAEFAGRLGIRAASGVDAEDRVIDALTAQATVEERPATADEIRELEV